MTFRSTAHITGHTIFLADSLQGVGLSQLLLLLMLDSSIVEVTLPDPPAANGE